MKKRSRAASREKRFTKLNNNGTFTIISPPTGHESSSYLFDMIAELSEIAQEAGCIQTRMVLEAANGVLSLEHERRLALYEAQNAQRSAS
jgi:hypothetical protein